MKILYISPENTVGTLSLWKKAHEELGNECLFITLYPTRNDYDPGICLNLPLVSSSAFYINKRHKYYKLHHGALGSYSEKEGYPPVWKPNSKLEQYYFQFRDWLWHFKVEQAIKEFDLFNFDIFHFEWGLEFYRDGRFVRHLAKAGKPIVCSYHGQDLRTRGVIPAIDKCSQLNLTSELDLMPKHPNLQYLFLPFDTKQFTPNYELNDPVKICHSPSNRWFKGSETIIPICEKLAAEGEIEFILIENKSHAETLEIKSKCDILIDQIHNRGGWGYGMNSVEALAMGLCCATELVPEYTNFIQDHPFITIDGNTLYNSLKQLISDRDQLVSKKRNSRNWVEKYHDYRMTAKTLYQYYKEAGWL